MIISGVRIVNQTAIEYFKRKHPNSRKPLDLWVKVTRSSEWKMFFDIKKTFNSVDKIKNKKDKFCFDIKGNDYRLIVVIKFQFSTVKIEHVFTHSEYEKWNKK